MIVKEAQLGGQQKSLIESVSISVDIFIQLSALAMWREEIRGASQRYTRAEPRDNLIATAIDSMFPYLPKDVKAVQIQGITVRRPESDSQGKPAEEKKVWGSDDVDRYRQTLLGELQILDQMNGTNFAERYTKLHAPAQ